MRLFYFAILIVLTSCSGKKAGYRILGNIEDPQNQIAYTMAAVLNKDLQDSIIVNRGVGSIANLDSLEKGSADFGIVDNYSKYSDKVTSIAPLYPQVLHILHRKNMNPVSLKDLFSHHKVFAGLEGSGTKRFAEQLMADFGIDKDSIEFVSVYDFFQADVIFSFTDLLSQDELKDLYEYKLFSIDNVDNLGRGSLAESICTRYPQFEPYIIARNIYGDFAKNPVLTVKVDAVLVCRTALDNDLIYNVMKSLQENRQDIVSINPLLYSFSADFDPGKLNFKLHPGARNYMERYQPTLLEKHADLLGVVISIFVALASALYSISQWQRAKKKNKIDVYYKRLMSLRKEIQQARSILDTSHLGKSLRSIQEETIELVIKEKLLADESFSIFLNLSKITMAEIGLKELELTKIRV